MKKRLEVKLLWKEFGGNLGDDELLAAVIKEAATQLFPALQVNVLRGMEMDLLSNPATVSMAVEAVHGDAAFLNAMLHEGSLQILSHKIERLLRCQRRDITTCSLRFINREEVRRREAVFPGYHGDANGYEQET